MDAMPLLGLRAKIGLAAALPLAACQEDPPTQTSFGFGGSDSSSSSAASSTSPVDGTGSSSSTSVGVTEGGSTAIGATGGTGGECAHDIDCIDDNPCTYDFCGAGSCVNDPMNQVPSPDNQVDGDCLVLLCLDGTATPVAQDSDLPADRDVCVDVACNAGVVEHPFSPPGTPCNLDGVCDGAGVCSECISPDDCDRLPPDDECQARTCEGRACGQAFTAADTPLSAVLQQPGDCQLAVCDGSGGQTSLEDDADTPDDGLQCTIDTCDAGEPGSTPLPPGTPCAAGVCNADGVCVGCNTPADCGGVDTFCRTITCEDGICGVLDTTDGTALPVDSQAAADCLEVQCQDGFAVPVADDDDLPADDGFQCTDDACSAGMVVHPDLPVGTPCNEDGGVACDGAGTCVECNNDSDCAAPPTCEVAQCVNHECVNQPASPGTPCSDGIFCNGAEACDATGSCVSPGDPCPGADGDSNCAEMCNELTDSCSGNDAVGSACNDGLFCTTGDTCDGSGTCMGGGSPCLNVGDNDNNCHESCNEALDNCTANDPFGSFCNDGLFCTTNDACDGDGSCAGSGNPCTIHIGDNDSDCSESCNEIGNSCTFNDPAGSACNDGLFCTVSDTCNGSGSCSGTGNPCTANVGDDDSDCTESCNEGANSCTATDPNGSNCNDGLFCTATDTCTAGVCGGTGNPCPGPDGDNNCGESCNETANNCTANDPNNSVCNDGLFCTSNDRCSSGTCVGGANPCPGPDGDTDCSESCNETANACSANDPNGSACDVSCFINGTCSNGGCITICP